MIRTIRLATGVLASAALVSTSGAALAATTPSGSGFLVSPVKAPGPLPIEIDNLSGHARTYDLAEVQTRMYSKKVCGPTTIASHVLAFPASVTVPAHKTVRIPVKVAHAPAVLTDVAVRVTQADPAKDHGQVGITAAVYAQELVGKGSASGCAVIRGDARQHTHSAVAASHQPSSHPPFLLIGLMLIVAIAFGFVLARVSRLRGRRRTARHALGSDAR